MKHIVLIIIYSLTAYMLCAEDNPCTPNVDCGSCLRSNGKCYWCKDQNWTASVGTDSRPRCDYESNLKLCNNVSKVDGSVAVNDDANFTNIIQVKPQKVTLQLRPDQPKSFSIKVNPAKDFPVSLYYLMDMSASMNDDLASLQRLGTKIANEIKLITKNYKLGFGSFVDKTVAPYVQIEKLDVPCIINGVSCVKTFGYQHVFNFTEDPAKFEDAVTQQKISGNLDTPEGVLDGLMQVAVCTKELNWPDIDKARRIVVVVTDATPHISGDGKLGGIILPNDGACHLDRSGLYTESNNQDYPSFSQLKTKLKENKIVPILAVTSTVYPVYKKLTEEWIDLGASIGELSRDSSNIVELIRESYKDISQTVRLTNEKVDGISVSYKPKTCRKPDGDSVCKEVAIEEEVEFTVTVDATCPKDKSKYNTPKNLKIVIPGFGDVDVNINLICDCPCEKLGGEFDSTKCNGTGDFQCGICYCPPGRYGDQCECDGFSRSDTTQCRQSNETDVVCNGLGNCVCGKCVCDKRNIQSEIISGTFCQCTNFGCGRYEGELCGGSDRGECECGKCKCKDEYWGDNCREVNCTIAEKKCFVNGFQCSGNGECECGTCVCDEGYEGKHCENCVSCSRKCSNNKDCVFCLFGKGEKEVCDQCDLNVRYVNETEDRCVYQDDDRCYIIFNFEQHLGGNETVLVRKEKRCVDVVIKNPDIIAIVLGTIGGIVLIGIILLLLWKFFVTTYDNHEYRKFEKDRMRSKWENDENPIYRPSQQKFQNPAYAGAQ